MSPERLPERVRLIALDLDGTVLTSERTIHPLNAAAIRRARLHGVHVVLASGRIRPSMMPFASSLGLSPGPLVCSNGAHVVNIDGSTLFSHKIDREVQGEIIDLAVREGLHLNGYAPDRMFYVSEDSWLDLYRTRARTIPTCQVTLQELREMELIKLMVIAQPERIRRMAQLGPGLLSSRGVTLTESEPEYLEFLPVGANKASGLARLCEQIGIRSAQVMAVGDYHNDLEMVQWAGIGVAMGNAVPEVKAAAEYTVVENDEAGVAEAIDLALG